MLLYICKLALCICTYFVTNIVLNIQLVIVSLNKLKGLPFAKMACKAIFIKTGKEFTLHSLIVQNVQAVEIVQQSVVLKMLLSLEFLVPFASSTHVIYAMLACYKGIVLLELGYQVLEQLVFKVLLSLNVVYTSSVNVDYCSQEVLP